MNEKITQPSKEELEADVNERTTAVGLYHYALSYRSAADALGAVKLGVTHPDAPREFLYYHGIELFLKAYLRHTGLSVMALKDISHSTGKLENEFLKRGGELTDEDRGVLDIMEKTDVVTQSRYIRTGAYTKPTVEALARTSKTLSDTVRSALKQSGLLIR